MKWERQMRLAVEGTIRFAGVDVRIRVSMTRADAEHASAAPAVLAVERSELDVMGCQRWVPMDDIEERALVPALAAMLWDTTWQWPTGAAVAHPVRREGDPQYRVSWSTYDPTADDRPVPATAGNK